MFTKFKDLLMMNVSLFVEVMYRYLIIRIAICIVFAGLSILLMVKLIDDQNTKRAYSIDTSTTPTFYENNIGEIITVDETGESLDKSTTFVKPKTIQISIETDVYDGSKHLVIRIIK